VSVVVDSGLLVMIPAMALALNLFGVASKLARLPRWMLWRSPLDPETGIRLTGLLVAFAMAIWLVASLTRHRAG
jgi:hypothetical protein